jgi:glycosyltransferase involved in cell wall biosynthesis
MGSLKHMKTLITTGIYPPDIGGPATFIPELARELQLRGDLPTVVTLKPMNFDGVYPTFPLILIKRTKNRVYRFVKSLALIQVNAARSDRIFANGLYIEAGIAAFIFRKKAVAKLVGEPIWEKCRNQGLTSQTVSEFQFSRLSLKHRILKSFYKLALNQFQVLYCPSMELVEIFQSWGVRSPIKYIPNGVRVSELKQTRKSYDLVCVSRLVKWKNVDQCIRVASALDLSLLIIGTGPEMQKLKTLSDELSANITFAGDCNPTKVIEYLSASRIYLLISQYEGMSFSLLEAMSLELAVVVSNTPGNLVVIHDGYNGQVVEPDNLSQIIEKVSSLITDQVLCQQQGAAARETVLLNYNSRNRISEVIELIAK